MPAAPHSALSFLRNLRPLMVAGLLAVGFLVSNHGAAGGTRLPATHRQPPSQTQAPLASRARTWVMATSAVTGVNQQHM